MKITLVLLHVIGALSGWRKRPEVMLETKQMDQHLVFIHMENFSLSQKIKYPIHPTWTLLHNHFHGPQACFLHQVSCVTKSSKKSFDVSFPHPQVPQFQLSWERTWQEIQWTIRESVLEWAPETGEICTFEHRGMKKKADTSFPCKLPPRASGEQETCTSLLAERVPVSSNYVILV